MSPITAGKLLRSALEHHQAGRFAAAEAAYRQILAEVPDHPDALNLLGLLAHQVGRNDAAEELIRRAIRLAPGHAHGHLNLGNVLQAMGRLDEAIASFRHALDLDPALAEAHNNLGFALAGQGLPEPAMQSLKHALALRPDFPEALNNLGMILESAARPEEAIPCLERAVAVRPGYAEAHNNLGNALTAVGRLDEALRSYRRALDLRPAYAEAHNNLGQAWQDQGQVDAAIASFDAALALRPGLAQAQWNKALALLLNGDFAAGWPLFEARWEALGPRVARRHSDQPLWLGESSLAGRTILLHHEQGLGDTVQMLRYVSPLTDLGARVVVEVPQTLAAIAATTAGSPQIVVEDTPVPDFDFQCPFMSLPLALRTTLESIPGQVPYLHAPASVQAAWRARLGAKRCRRVGLAWSGAAGHRNDRQRSLPAPLLAPLLDLDIEFHSLQKEYRAGGVHLPGPCAKVSDWAAQLDDLAETAGLIAQLDLVITVDTAVAHLAGALGKPVWLLLPFAPDYRWLLDRTDSPWYPTMRLFRQHSAGDWEGVISRVVAALG
jgi:tetratricopeptide (TPR) repeat protein